MWFSVVVCRRRRGQLDDNAPVASQATFDVPRRTFADGGGGVASSTDFRFRRWTDVERRRIAPLGGCVGGGDRRVAFALL